MPVTYGRIYRRSPALARLYLLVIWELTRSISETARMWHTSPQVVRRAIQRYKKDGVVGLADHSRRPRNSPKQTPKEIEAKVVMLWKMGYTLNAISIWWIEHGWPIRLKVPTIRSILRRNKLTRRQKGRPLGSGSDWHEKILDHFTERFYRAMKPLPRHLTPEPNPEVRKIAIKSMLRAAMLGRKIPVPESWETIFSKKRALRHSDMDTIR